MYQPLHNDYTPRYIRWWLHWLTPRNYWKQLQYSWQRCTRGWADCDVWSLDAHLCDILVPTLLHLKKHKMGIPGSLLTEDTTHEEAIVKWDIILDQMILGFRAGHCLISDEGAEGYFGPGPAKNEDLLAYLKKPSQFDLEGYKTWQEARQVEFDQGMRLFHEYFFSLWD